MRYRRLGATDLAVSELCLGALPMGPLQADLAPAEGARVVARALELGVNFLDTAQNYRTYPHLARALAAPGPPVYVATKSTAADGPGMQAAIDEARRELGRDVIDIFHLHAARSGPEVFAQRAGALECLLEARQKGVVRAVGVATHAVTVVRAAAGQPEIDVVFPLINVAGLGVLEGSRDEMAAAIAAAARAGKGVYAMKVLGGGNLVGRWGEAIDYVRALPGITAVAVGMISPDEVVANARYFAGIPPAAEHLRALARHKQLLIARFCRGCGQCVEHCPAGALGVRDGRCWVDAERCVLCGYCAPTCPQFAIRMV